MRLANGGVVSVTHENIALQITVDTSCGPGILDPKRYACTSGSDAVAIVGRVTVDKLGVNLNTLIFQLAGAQRVVAGVEEPGYESSQLCDDSPAEVELMKVQLKPRAQAIEDRPRRYDPAKRKWLAGCGPASTTLGRVVVHLEAVWAPPMICVPKHDSFCLVSGQAMNARIE